MRRKCVCGIVYNFFSFFLSPGRVKSTMITVSTAQSPSAFPGTSICESYWRLYSPCKYFTSFCFFLWECWAKTKAIRQKCVEKINSVAGVNHLTVLLPMDSAVTLQMRSLSVPSPFSLQSGLQARAQCRAPPHAFYWHTHKAPRCFRSRLISSAERWRNMSDGCARKPESCRRLRSAGASPRCHCWGSFYEKSIAPFLWALLFTASPSDHKQSAAVRWRWTCKLDLNSLEILTVWEQSIARNSARIVEKDTSLVLQFSFLHVAVYLSIGCWFCLHCTVFFFIAVIMQRGETIRVALFFHHSIQKKLIALMLINVKSDFLTQNVSFLNRHY